MLHLLRTILYFTFTGFMLLSEVYGQVSPKRGMAYGYHSVQDLTTVSAGASWWYNWASVPDADVAAYYQSIGVEFVPMVWGGTFNVNTVINNIRPDAKYLLAFNEPNFNVESNLTPQQAVNLWPQIEQIAAAKNLEIVSAAPAYCGGSVCVPGYTSPITWHDEFFALCPTCKVDYIAFHTYEPSVGGAVYLTNTLKKYGRPIWVTEFANWDASQAPADKITFLQQMVQNYENDPDIYRYAWFTGRSTPNPAVDLLGANGALTNLGTAYINAAYGPQTTVPGKVEAEDHYRRRGTDLQATTDVGGGENVGWTDAGTWMEYILDVPTAGSYTFNFRVASNVSTGSFNIYVDDVLVKSNITVNSTGGWQTWANLPVTGIVFTSGEHLVRLVFTNTGTNMNYFNVNYEGTVVADADFTATPVTSCVGNSIVFTDATMNKTGGETYAWNFGAGATPATATGEGPHTVSYSSSGSKSVSLTVTNNVGPNTETKNNYVTIASPPTGCLFSDEYSNNNVNWISPSPSAFSHTESGNVWRISNGGYGEWESFFYELNNGTAASPLNFSCAANKPIVHIRARASANALLRITMVDGTGKAIDNMSTYNLELTPSYQTFSIDFTGRFRNYYGPVVGVVDSSTISSLQFAVNPGYFSFPLTGVNGTYNSYFPGTIDIDWIGIGANCAAPVLPVELISFSGKTIESYAELKWITATETNNDFFEIEKSVNGTDFISLDKVKGNGNTNFTMYYSWKDFSRNPGVVYYRLKQVDFDGSYSYSNIISIGSGREDASWFNIYPNPSEGNDFTLEFRGENEMRAVQICNLLGEVISTLKTSSSVVHAHEFVDALPQGVYILRINDFLYPQKLIIK